ncbi:hypothetical protein COOONC_09620 [Cooperia oncophora]
MEKLYRSSGLTQNVVTTITDQFPSLRKRYELVVIGFCSLSLLAGLTMCQKNGYHWFNLFFGSVAGTAVLILCLIEIIICVFAYGETKTVMGIVFVDCMGDQTSAETLERTYKFH